jgi:hypothetical protein
MNMIESNKWHYIVLGVLQVFISLGAIPAGVSMILDPTGAGVGMSLEWLAGSPFPNFLIPGLVLTGVNGLGSLAGAVLSFRRQALAPLAAIGLGMFLMAWITVQWLIPGLGFHWLQPLFFGLGAIELVLGWLLDPQAVRKVFGQE